MARNYDVLRQEHQKEPKPSKERDEGAATQPARDSAALDSELTKSASPARQTMRWTDAGGMVQQQSSATAWAKSAHQHRQQANDRAGDRGPSNDNPSRAIGEDQSEQVKEPVSQPNEQEKMAARQALNAEHAGAPKLSFAKDREGQARESDPEREQAAGEQKSGDGKSALSFARDRADPSRDYGR